MDASILEKYAKAALDAKKAQEEKLLKKKESINYKVPRRLTIDLVKEAYAQTELIPSRNFYFFLEGNPCLHASYLNGRMASPFGALALYEASKLPKPPSWIKEEAHLWSDGAVAKITGFNISYVLGFNSGFDGHAPGHRMCSYEFHCGYADGKILSLLLARESSLPESPDPLREEQDLEILDEIVRVKGYWKDAWGPKPEILTDVVDLTEQRALELGISL